MKFKKITKLNNIIRLTAAKPSGSMKNTYYEVWDDGIHYGNLCGGTSIPKREWEFIPDTKGDTGGVDAPGLNYEQLMQIVIKICQLNKKSGLTISDIPGDYIK